MCRCSRSGGLLKIQATKPDASDSYALLTTQLIPHGLLGLVVAGFFSHTMAMASSDANATASVFTRDVMPAPSRAARADSAARTLPASA